MHSVYSLYKVVLEVVNYEPKVYRWTYWKKSSIHTITMMQKKNVSVQGRQEKNHFQSMFVTRKKNIFNPSPVWPENICPQRAFRLTLISIFYYIKLVLTSECIFSDRDVKFSPQASPARNIFFPSEYVVLICIGPNPAWVSLLNSD